MSDRSPRFRSVLDQFAPYKPGRRVANAQGQSFKLASNECPFGPLPSVAKAITAAAAEINWYPDNTAAALTEAIARRYDVPAAHIALGCGSVGVAQQLLAAAAWSRSPALPTSGCRCGTRRTTWPPWPPRSRRGPG